MRIRVIVSLAAIVGLLLCVGSASAGTLAQSLARVSVPADDRSADLKTLADARTLAKDLGGSRSVALKAIIKSATQIGN